MVRYRKETMADVKYQIFLSSTFTDLREERQAVSRAILDLGHIPAGMEMFPAADVEQLDYIKKVIDECDYYLLIVGARYGSLDPLGVSFTEREYDYAVETRKTVLGFIHADVNEVAWGKTDKSEEKFAKLQAFKDKVCNGRLVQFWSTPAELASKTILSLTKAFGSDAQAGWVRADSIPSHSSMADVLRFREENDRLRQELAQLRESIIPTFPNAADLTARFTLNYTFSTRYGKTSKSVTLTYAHFLRLIAPALHAPSNFYQAMQQLRSGLKDRNGVIEDNIAFNYAEIQDALLHLTATGHVKMWSGSSTNGTPVTGYQLTEQGVKRWQEMSYKRATKASASAEEA